MTHSRLFEYSILHPASCIVFMGIDNRTCFQVNLRDGLRCRVCGRAPVSQQNYHRGFEYHHLQMRSEGGLDEIENLILLCHECHTLHHKGRLTLPHFDDLKLAPTFKCHQCEVENETETVEMNCGWYRCESCRNQTHLWAHCGFEDERSSTRSVEKDEL